MADRVHEIVCPGCGVALPMTATDVPTEGGLSTSFDESYIDEHMVMHAKCDCVWMDQQRHHSPSCPVHGTA
jgi:hypothetical protein